MNRREVGEDCLNMLSYKEDLAIPLSNMTMKYAMTDCTRLLQPNDLPLYTTSQSSFRQENANDFVKKARNNNNSFQSSVQFHINNIENFPVIVHEILGSKYVIKGVS